MVVQRVLFAGLASLLLYGCSSTCQSVCDKLLSCEALDVGDVGDKECELDCAVQQSAYEGDEERTAAFEAYKDCVLETSCEELIEGACHNEALYAF